MTFKEHLKDIGSHSVIYFAGWVISFGIRLSLLPVFTRYLNRAEYGTVSLLDSAIELFRILCALGFGEALVRFYHARQDAAYKRSVMATGAGIMLIATVFFGLIIFPFSRSLTALILGTGGQTFLFQLALGTVLMNILRSVSDTYLTANKRSLNYIAISTSYAIFQGAINLYLVVFRREGMTGMLTGNLISTSIYGSCLFGYVVYKNGISLKKELAVPMLKFGAPLVPSLWAAAAMHNMDRFFIRHYRGLEEVGLYSLAYQFPFMLNTLFLTSFNRIWNASSIYEIARSPDAPRQYGRVCTYYMMMLTVAMFSISILSDTVIRLFAAPSYFDAYRYLPIIALGIWGYSLHTFVKPGVLLTKKTYLLTINFTLAFICNLVLNFLLVPKWGAMGAAWASVLTYFAFSLGGFFIYRICYPISLEWMRLLKMLSLAIALFICRQAIHTPDAKSALFVEIAFLMIFPALLLVVLNPAEKKQIKKWYLAVFKAQ